MSVSGFLINGKKLERPHMTSTSKIASYFSGSSYSHLHLKAVVLNY